jgi:16S rRNA (uracil1498-N3)-methyltransferase
VERGDRAALAPAPVATFLAPDLAAVARSGDVTLGEAVAHHARVKRLEEGDVLRLTDGAGCRALATIARIGKKSLEARVMDGSVEQVAPLPPVTLLVPVADRERMLWLAEKCAELALTRWSPVVFQRSRSVSPRGEGSAFGDKVRARMVSALEQSGGAWLPNVSEERTVEQVLDDQKLPANRILLDAAGEVLTPSLLTAPMAIALGPEGGLEPSERERFVAAGWRPVRLAPTILRFETAGVAALSLARALVPAPVR